MKRSTLKLAIRRETLRFLTEMEIFRVGGGDADTLIVTDDTGVKRLNVDVDSAGPVNGCPALKLL